MLQEWTTLLMQPLEGFWMEISAKLPGILAALVLLLIGMVVARVIRTGVQRGLKYANLDQITDKVKLNELVARLGMGRSPSFIIGFAAYWLIILVFTLSASNAVKMTVVSQMLQRFLMFLPQLLGAVLVL